MTRIRFAMLAVTTAFLASAADAALAQDKIAADKATATIGNFYAGATAGMVVPEDVGFSANSSRGGTTTSGSGKFQFDNGYSVSGLGGYKINPYVAGEVEMAYASFDYSKVTGNFTATSGGTSTTVSGSANLQGSVDSVIGLGRAVVTPLGNTQIRPLLGAGLGFASTSEKITKIGTTAVNSSTDHTDLALEGMAGLEADVSSHISLGARYRYLWVNSGENGLENFTAHNMMGTATYHF